MNRFVLFTLDCHLTKRMNGIFNVPFLHKNDEEKPGFCMIVLTEKNIRNVRILLLSFLFICLFFL